MKDLPNISIVIPTLNAQKVLKTCLEAISIQDYPKDKIEIIIADGGSTDQTLNLARKYGAKIVKNKLKTAESGKAVGVKNTTGDYVALIDSDNFLPTKDWLNQMVIPLEKHSEAIGSEPWSYTWRKEDGFITRYCALIGMNDPLVHFLGNYDRMNLLTGTWTEISHTKKDFGDYLLVSFDKGGVPTIGANGAVFRAKFLKDNLFGDYLFDIDILAKCIKERGSVDFIKVKNGVVHSFCEKNVCKFAKKQRRRVKDYLFHRYKAKDRIYPWQDTRLFSRKNLGVAKFVLYCVTVLPLFLQSLKGYLKKPDLAWFFHPLACEITLWEYGWGRFLGIFKKEEISRENWKQ